MILTEALQTLRKTPPSWIPVTSGAVFLWFSILFLLNELNLSFFALARGKGLVVYNVKIFLFSPEADYAIWLLSLAAILLTFLMTVSIKKAVSDRGVNLAALLLILSLATYFPGLSIYARIATILAATIIIYRSVLSNVKLNKLSKRRAVEILAGVWLTFLLSIELLASIRWFLNGFDGTQPFSDSSWNISFLELQITNILQPILPRLFILFSEVWILRILLIPYEKTALVSKIRNSQLFSNNPTAGVKANLPKILLGLAVVTTVLISTYPYLPTLNPSSRLVSVDARFYYNIMQNYIKLDTSAVVANIIQQDRELYLVFQQIVATITGSPDLTIRVIPVILGVLLTMSVYHLVSTSLKDKALAALAALFTATSFQTVAGINAGFYANWLALTEINIFIVFFLKALEDSDNVSKYSAISALVAVSILFTHSATWIVLMVSLAVYGLILFVKGTLGRHDIAVIAQIILVNIAFEMFKNNVLKNTSTTGVAQTMTPNVSYSNILAVFRTLDVTFTYFLGGAYANPLILILATIGLFYIARSRQKFYLILLAVTIVCTMGTLFTSSTMPDLLQSRFIYLIPFQILSAIGLKILLNLSTNIFNKDAGLVGRSIPFMLQMALFASLLSYALRIVGFIYIG